MGKNITVCPEGGLILDLSDLSPTFGNGLGPSVRVQGGKGPCGGVPGAGLPALLPPAARTRSPVLSLLSRLGRRRR